MNALLSSETDCWYTPVEIVVAAQNVMGSIDLDPASDSKAYQMMQSIPKKFYTANDLPLMQSWHGNVFLNPPGGKDNGKSLSRLFWEKLLFEYEIGHCQQAIFIVFNLNSGIANNPDMARFPICFSSRSATAKCVNGSGRIKYINVDGKESSPTHASAIIYLGDHLDNFCQEFKAFGQILKP